MRIAIIGPNFTHGLTYQENMWAEHLTRLGHAVRVFHAAHVTTSPRLLTEGYGSFQEQQVQARFLPRSTYSSLALAGAVADFRPELIVVHGDKLFAKHVMLDDRLASVPLIATFSENAGMHEYDWRKPGISVRQRLWAMGFRVMRAGPMRLACRRATMLIGNTPQARNILLSLFDESRERERVDRKIVGIPLGFSPDQFGYRPDVRRAVRAELGLRDDEIVVCASSHLDAVKAQYMMKIIDALQLAMKGSAELRGLIVGFSDSPGSSAASNQVSNHINAGPFDERFIRHPFADKARLSQLYNAADIAVFGRASISCQEALGTGLICCVADDGSMNHLVKRPEQAVFFRPGDDQDMAAKIVLAAETFQRSQNRHELRRQLADASRWLGYDQVIARAISELRQRVKQ